MLTAAPAAEDRVDVRLHHHTRGSIGQPGARHAVGPNDVLFVFFGLVAAIGLVIGVVFFAIRLVAGTMNVPCVAYAGAPGGVLRLVFWTAPTLLLWLGIVLLIRRRRTTSAAIAFGSATTLMTTRQWGQHTTAA
jgi:hypothetical protein